MCVRVCNSFKDTETFYLIHYKQTMKLIKMNWYSLAYTGGGAGPYVPHTFIYLVIGFFWEMLCVFELWTYYIESNKSDKIPQTCISQWLHNTPRRFVLRDYVLWTYYIVALFSHGRARERRWVTWGVENILFIGDVGNNMEKHLIDNTNLSFYTPLTINHYPELNSA